MSRTRSYMTVLKNYLYNTAYQLFVIIIPLVLTPYLSRTLGAEGMGIYSYTFNICYIFSLFSLLGMKNYGSRIVAQVRDNKKQLSKIFWELYSIQLTLSIAVIVLYVVYLKFFVTEYISFYLVQGIYLISVCFDLTWFFSGIENFKDIIIKNTGIKLLSAVLIFSKVKCPDDISTYIFIMSSSALAGNLVLLGKLKQIICFSKPKIKNIFVHIKPLMLLFVSVIAISVYKSMDKVMIQLMSNVTELGLYEYADKINYVQICISTSLGTVMLPRMSNILKKENSEKVQYIIQVSMQVVMVLTFGMSMGIISIAEQFVPLYLGDGYQKTVSILKLLSISSVFVSWANVIRTLYLIPFSKDKLYVKSVIMGAFVNLTFNCAFIPIYGAIGAAFSTILAEFTVAVYQTWYVRKDIPFNCMIQNAFCCFACAGVMTCIVCMLNRMLHNSIMTLIWKIVVGAVAYLSLIILYLHFLEPKLSEDLKKLI